MNVGLLQDTWMHCTSSWWHRPWIKGVELSNVDIIVRDVKLIPICNKLYMALLGDPCPSTCRTRKAKAGRNQSSCNFYPCLSRFHVCPALYQSLHKIYVVTDRVLGRMVQYQSPEAQYQQTWWACGGLQFKYGCCCKDTLKQECFSSRQHGRSIQSNLIFTLWHWTMARTLWCHSDFWPFEYKIYLKIFF